MEEARSKVYFVSDGRGRVKIGYVKHAWNLDERLRRLQTGASHRLSLLRAIDGTQRIESWLHRRFAKQRLDGEWFAFTNEMLTIIPPDEFPQKEWKWVK